MNNTLTRWLTPFSGAKIGRLRQELVLLVHGQAQIADRLLRFERQYSPGHHEAWYLEKVIYDLRRRR